MENRKTKNAVSLETFVFLVLFGVGAAAIGMTMGGGNMMKTLMATAYELLLYTVFNIMAIAVIAGALSGSESIPADWISQLDYATSINPHTNSKRTLKENADGVYHAFKKMLKRQQAYIQQMDID